MIIPALRESSGSVGFVPSLVKRENRQERCVDRSHFIAVQPPGKLAQSHLGVDDCQLLYQHSRFHTIDVDLWAKGSSTSTSRRGGDDPRGQRKIVGLNHHCITRPSLLVASRVLRCPESVQITTHGSHPSQRPTHAKLPRQLHHCASFQLPRAFVLVVAFSRLPESLLSRPPTATCPLWSMLQAHARLLDQCELSGYSYDKL